ncbi:MAG: disulfide bond formation protein B [Gammaproteobacteria bacterium]|nr:disulfide bond formation protein B [Gammaproteobacteria bacterium]
MTIRSTYLLGLGAVSALLLTSIYFQLFEGMMPCPLCTLQRIAFILLGILFLAGTLTHSKHLVRLIINTLCLLVSIAGIFFAGRQVWLQHFPSANNTECGVSIQYMMHVLSMNEVLEKVFAGSAECTQRGWEFLHLNMAEWALLWFIGFSIMAIYLFVEEVKWKKHKK